MGQRRAKPEASTASGRPKQAGAARRAARVRLEQARLAFEAGDYGLAAGELRAVLEYRIGADFERSAREMLARIVPSPLTWALAGAMTLILFSLALGYGFLHGD